MGDRSTPGVRCLLASLLLAAAAPAAQSRPGILAPGIHAVGFCSSIGFDEDRMYRTAFDDGVTYGGSGSAPRPVLISLWYPAAPAPAAAPMSYRRYFELRGGAEDADRWARALAHYAADVCCTELFGKPVAELDVAECRLWERFLDTPTTAHPDVAPAEGRHPYVIYHAGAGSSYEDNSAFCEFLASHGYVVLSSAYPKADGSEFGTDSGAGSVRDMEFLARHARALPYVDGSRGAYGGHSAGAQACLLALQQPECPVGAVFLLDTTLDYYSLAIPNYRRLIGPVLERIESFTAPMLVIAGPDASFQLCDRLERAERVYLTLPELSHNEFIAQGVWRLRTLAWRTEAADEPENDSSFWTEAARAPAVERLYAALCEATRRFLDANLTGRQEPFASLCAEYSRNGLGGAEPCVELVPIGAKGPEPFDPRNGRPPTPRQLRPWLEHAGIDQFLATLDAHREAEAPSPIFRSGMIMSSLLYDLAVADRLAAARALHAWTAAHGPDAIQTLRFLAEMSRLVQRPQDARETLEVAVTIAPDHAGVRADLERLVRE